MMISDAQLDQWLQEDVPYLDLTTHALGIGQMRGQIRFTARHPLVVCGTEAVARLLQVQGAQPGDFRPSGDRLQSGHTLLEATGTAANLHRVWKVGLNVLEYACGVATLTNEWVALAQTVNPAVMLYTTRKHIPGTKSLAIRAILAGGAYPHRLGLSETVLVFAQHLNFLGGLAGFCEKLAVLKRRALEKKIVVEVSDVTVAATLAAAGVDAIQFDKVPAADLAAIAPELRATYPHLTLLAAGGIQRHNLEAYAATGVQGLVLTAPYFAPPADIGVTIQPL